MNYILKTSDYLAKNGRDCLLHNELLVRGIVCVFVTVYLPFSKFGFVVRHSRIIFIYFLQFDFAPVCEHAELCTW
jgi:hypothetical protein